MAPTKPGTNLLQRAPQGERAEPATVALLRTLVGEYTLFLDPQAVLAVEPRREVVEDDFIVRIDLREWLKTEAAPTSEGLLLAGDAGVYRLIVCAVLHLQQSQIARVHRFPTPLSAFGRRVGLRGVVEAQDGTLGYLVDIVTMAEVAEQALAT